MMLNLGGWYWFLSGKENMLHKEKWRKMDVLFP